MKNKKRERALALACCAAMAALMPMMLTRRAGLTFRFSGRKRSASRASRASPTTIARLTPTNARLSEICFQRSVIGITSKQKCALSLHSGREKTQISFAYLLPSRLYCRYRSFTDSTLTRSRTWEPLNQSSSAEQQIFFAGSRRLNQSFL